MDEESLAKEDKQCEKFVPLNMGLPYGSDKSIQAAKELKNAYFGDKPVSLETFNEYVAVSLIDTFEAFITYVKLNLLVL